MIGSSLIAMLVAGCFTFAPMPQTNVAATHTAGSMLPAPPADAFTSKPGRFSISIPEGFSDPELETNNIPSEIGKIKLYMYTSVNETQGVCLVGYSDIKSITMTDELKEEMLEGAKEGALSNMNATLEGEESIMLDGHPGRSIRFTTDSEDTQMRGRMDYYMVDNRLYQVGFIEIANSALDGADVQEYFNSFKLISAAKKKKK